MKVIEKLPRIQVLAMSGGNLEYVDRFEQGISHARCFACMGEKTSGLTRVKPDHTMLTLRFVVPKDSRTSILVSLFSGVQYIHGSEDKKEKWIDIGACSEHAYKLNHFVELVHKYEIIDMRILARARKFNPEEI